MSSSTTSPPPPAATTTPTPAVPPSEASTARLVALPNNPKGPNAVSDLFPALSLEASGLPVPAVCHLSPGDGTATSPCPLPSAKVWDSFTACVTSNCNPNTGTTSGPTSRTSADEIAEIRTEECALRSCRDQFIAASANLCLPLTAQVMQAAQVFLPQLPSAVANDTTFASLHAQHLASVGQQQQQPSPSNSSNAAQGSLGICVSTIPIGTPCDPNNDYTSLASQASPWYLPAPSNAPLNPPQPGQPIYPKAMIAYTRLRGAASSASASTPSTPVLSTDQSFIFAPGTGTDQSRPPVLLRYLPTEQGQRVGAPSPDMPSAEKGRVLGSSNMYSLTFCDPRPRTHQPTLAPGATGCAFDAQCRHSLSCGRGATCAASAPTSWAPVAYLGNDAQDWLANEQRARSSQFTLQLVIVGVLCLLWCLHTCRARVFRAWVSVNRKVKGESNTVMREMALQPASNLMLDEMGEGGSRQERRGERGMIDEELGVVVLEGVDALPQYQPPGADRADVGCARVGEAGLGPPPPAFASVAPGASGPPTAGEEGVGPMDEASLATAESAEGARVQRGPAQAHAE